MRHWIIILVIIAVAFVVIGYLQDQGYLDVEWQALAMFFAAIAGPYKFVKNKLSKSNNKVDRILEENEKIKTEEKLHREVYDVEINQRKEKISEIESEIEVLDNKLIDLEKKKQKVEKEVNSMDSDQVKNEFLDLYGE